MGFTFDPWHIARRSQSDTQKALNAERGKVAVLSQVDGARWLSLEGIASVNRAPDAIRDAGCATPSATGRRGRTRNGGHRGAREAVLGSSTLLDRS